MYHLTLQPCIISFSVSLSQSGPQQVLCLCNGKREWGWQLALVAEDKLQLLSPAKCKISVIIGNITIEICPDADHLKIET